MINRIFSISLLLITLTSCGLLKRNETNGKDFKKKNIPEVPYEQQLKSSSLLIEGIKNKTLGNYSAAYESFLKAISNNPANDAANYEIAQILIIKNEISSALNYAKTASELDPENIWYKQLIAEICLSMKDYSAASKIYNALSDENPGNPDYLYEIARIHLLSGNYYQAIDSYDKIEKIIGVTEPVSQQKQSIYLYLGKPQKAVDEILKLVDAYPEEIQYLNTLGQLYIKIGKDDEALKTLLEVREKDSLDPDVDFSLSELYKDLNENNLSYSYLKKAFSNPQADIDQKVMALLTYYDKNKDTIARKQSYELAEILVETHPDDAKAHSIYADFLYRDNRKSEARNSFRKVIGIDSSKYVVWEQLLNIERELKDYKAMENESSRVMELFPEQPLPYYFNGYSNFELKNYTKSVSSLKAGLDYIVDNDILTVQFYSLLADSYYAEGDYENAYASYDKALLIQPDDVSVLNNYAYYLAVQGRNLPKAKEMAGKANEKAPSTPAYQDTYAWVLYKTGDYENAGKWLEKALDNGGEKDPSILEHYGDVLFKLGKNTEAVEYWKKAAGIDTGSDLLNKKIKEGKLYE